VNVNESAIDIFNKLKQVYGDGVISRSHRFEWTKRFVKGRMNIKNDVQLGHPLTVPMDKSVKKLGILDLTDVWHLD